METVNHEHFMNVIEDISRKEATDVIDRDDLQQELWVYLLERQDRVDNEGQMVTLLKKQARTVAKNERVDYMYFSGAFIYTPSMVRGLLADAVWADVENAFDIEGRVDVSRELKKLPYKDQRLLCKRFFFEEKPAKNSAEERDVYRAVDTLTHSLNLGSRSERADEAYVIDPQSLGGTPF